MVGIRLSSKQCGVIEDKPIAPEPIIPLDQLVAPAPSKPRRARLWPQLIGVVIVIAALVLHQRGASLLVILGAWLLLGLGGLWCLVGVCGHRPKWAAAIGLTAAAGYAGFFVFEASRLMGGDVRARDYPKVIASYPIGLAHFPRQIPADARDVRIAADGPFTPIPAPDWHVEARFITSPDAAQQILEQARKAAISPDLSFNQMSFASIPDQLQTADDADSATPLPPGYQSFILANPHGGGNVGGVTVSVQRGEVIYWLFEM